VFADIAHQPAIQVLHRGEDAAGNHIALDAREPILDLIQPGNTTPIPGG
jgi:hypothetical protein